MANISKIKLPSGVTYDVVDNTSGYITASTFVVTLTLEDPELDTYSTDKTAKEIYDAHNSGKVVLLQYGSYILLGSVWAEESDNYYQADFYEHEISNTKSNGYTIVTSNNNTSVDHFTYNPTFFTLNENNINYDSHAKFYAPTTAGTSGYVLKSNGSGAAPTWVSAKLTDEKLRVYALNTTTQTAYRLVLSYNSSTAETKYVTDGLQITHNDGSTTVEGNAILNIGTDVAKGTAGNQTGKINLYGDTAYRIELKAGSPTSNRVIAFPNKSGTVALTSDIPTETTVSGWGFTKNTGTLTGVTFAGTSMSVSSGVASITQANARTALGLATVATSGNYNDLTNKPTVPTITLNGSSTTSPSFYAPTSVGTSGQYLKSNGSGAPSWTNFPTIPTKTSQLTNDSGFITSYTETDPTVPSWAKASTKPTYTASEVGALPDTTTIPTKTSQLTNDSGFITTDTDTTYTLSNALSSHKFTSTLTAGGSGSGTSTATITFAAGSNVTLTDDTTNKKITIAATDTKYSAGTGLSLSGTTFNISTVPIANGGTGKTTAADAINVLLNGLPAWTATPTDSTYFIRQDTGGAASYGKATFSTLWTYINGKVALNYLPLTGGSVTGPVTFNDSITVDDAIIGSLVVNGNASFTNNISANTINGVEVGSSPKFTDTTYSSKAAASGGTAVSLVTTGEKYTWNSKTSNTGTVTSITLTQGTGISIGSSGTAITTSGSRTISLATITKDDTTSTASPSHGGTFTAIDSVTYDNYGRVTGVNTKTVTLPADSNTDTKVSTAAITSGTTYYPVVGTNTTSAATKYYDANGFFYKGTTGTTSAIGSSILTLGNSTSSGTANNKRGEIVLYGSTAYAHTIQGAPTAARTITLPNKTGTVALTSDLSSYLPLTGGTLTGNLTIAGELTVGGSNVIATDISDKLTLGSAWTQLIKVVYELCGMVFYYVEAKPSSYNANYQYTMATFASGYRPSTNAVGQGYTTDGGFAPKSVVSVLAQTDGALKVNASNNTGAYFFASGWFKI